MKINFETKYRVGQSVFRIHEINASMTETCSVCKGQPKVVSNGITYYCSNCNGSGKKYIGSKNKYVVADPIKIEGIAFYGEVDSIYSYLFETDDYDIFAIHESNLYATKEEAQARCDELEERKKPFFIKK